MMIVAYKGILVISEHGGTKLRVDTVKLSPLGCFGHFIP